MKGKKHIWHKDDYSVSFTYTGGEPEWQEPCDSVGVTTLICETYGDILTLWDYTPLSREKLCEPVRVEKGRKYYCTYYTEVRKLEMEPILTKKEVRLILKHTPHKWDFDHFGTDMFCKVCGHNLEGMNYKVAKVKWNDLSEEAQKNRLKLNNYITKGKAFNECGVKDIPALYNGSTTYAPIRWFDERAYLEEPTDEEDMFKSEFHYIEKKRNAIIDGTYEVDENNNVKFVKMDAEIVDCPYCAKLKEVFCNGYKNWPLWVKIVDFIKYKAYHIFIKPIYIKISDIWFNIVEKVNKNGND